MWGCSRLLLVWSVILCITVNSDALDCHVGKSYESCEGTHGTCFTIMGPGDVTVGTGCAEGERVDNECTNIQASGFKPRETLFHQPWLKRELSDGSQARDYAGDFLRELGIEEGKLCFCTTDGCNQENRLSVKGPPSFSDGRNGVSGFTSSESLLLGVLCFLAWKSFAE